MRKAVVYQLLMTLRTRNPGAGKQDFCITLSHPGRNVILNVMVERNGNRSECPMYLKFNHVALKTDPWLADKMDEDDYTNLTSPG